MWTDLLQKQRAERFAGLRGADVRGRVPIREPLLQPILQQAVRSSDGRLGRLVITIQDANMFALDATVSVLFFRKNVRLQLRIDPVVDFSVSPLMKIHILESQGIPGFVVEFLLKLLPFPESISIMPRLVTINLKTALTRRKLDEFVPLLKRLSLSTQRGCATVDFHFGVD